VASLPAGALAGSWPVRAAKTLVVIATSAPRMPIWSRDGESGWVPASSMTPNDGLKPTTPQ